MANQEYFDLSFDHDYKSQVSGPQMHASLQEEYNSPEWQRALQTLNLSLEEVAHIRSVLTKAELEVEKREIVIDMILYLIQRNGEKKYLGIYKKWREIVVG